MSCEVCDGPLRSDNQSGLCNRTIACETERRRRDRQRASGPFCRCSHPEAEHPGGECIRAACGCLEWRPAAVQDVKSAARREAG
jgi:hypothetical protein